MSKRDPFLESLRSLPTFVARQRACDAKFPRLKAGTGRIVYDYDGAFVLKLAKNKKGIAQNGVEAQGCLQSFYAGTILARVPDSCSEDTWLFMEKALRAKPRDFVAAFGCPFPMFQEYLRYSCEVRYTTNWHYSDIARQTLDEHELMQELTSMIMDYDLCYGDFQRVNSWGKVQDKLVVIDYGCNREVFEEFYERKPARQRIWS